MKILFASAGRMLVTLLVVLAAIVVGWQLWSYYMLAPWTRDGRVRADVVTETDNHEKYQANAPAVQAGLYVVPRVIE